MNKTLVVTAICADRPGLVQMLSEVIYKHEASWEESSMAHLSGQFAGILTVNVDENVIPALEKDLRALSDQGMAVTLNESSEATDAVNQQIIWLDLTGQNKPGIMREVSNVFVAQGVSVQSLDTEVVSASMSGGDMFVAGVQLEVSKDFDLESLQHALEDLSDDLMVDLAVADDE
ncbi:MAG: glycine cleavage system protein R [Oceanospirillaceae bacterium]|jgi:glycine cleavage system regulatory protein|nr:glycine cleavage system protein R [Oceanospirillaceae bacterium]MBT4441965.1 glycine cleavage system protein R [Oceanospirillaceae bacterium]MBT6077180.1 glycine cleavage system protein R [Oceanospirillaceae bacterium]MBT7331182.1 glycine cleavage system protein R [Oceanospirillaceae bacterium]